MDSRVLVQRTELLASSDSGRIAIAVGIACIQSRASAHNFGGYNHGFNQTISYLAVPASILGPGFLGELTVAQGTVESMNSLGVMPRSPNSTESILSISRLSRALM
jgi:hypothetical protein